jgi:hypothetical protein
MFVTKKPKLKSNWTKRGAKFFGSGQNARALPKLPETESAALVISAGNTFGVRCVPASLSFPAIHG